MDFESDNNSIFDGLNHGNVSMPQNIPMPEEPKQGGLIGNFINSIKNKLDEAKIQKQENLIREGLEEFTEQNTDTLLILKSFGCVITVKDIHTIEISSSELNITGYMHIEDDTAEPDENCKRLFALISEIISGGYRIDDILNKYEESEFYPIGEIEQIEVRYKGTPIKASRGRLANPQGEIKTIVFYRGYEITPDEEDSK